MLDPGACLNVDRNLRLAARRTPSKVAVVDRDRSLSFEELDRRVNRVANALLGSGFRHGDRLAVFMTNRIEWIEILFACARVGVVCVPVNARFVDSEVAYVLAHSDAAGLIVEEALLSRLADREGELYRGLRTYIVGGAATRQGASGYEAWLARASDGTPEARIRDNDWWYLGYTSGTTGRPKAAIKTQYRAAIGAVYAGLEFGIGQADTSLIVMPLFHSNGIFFQMMQLSLGGTIIIMDGFDPEAVLQIVQTRRITAASLIPTMYAMILELPEAARQKFDLSSWTTLISSSAPLLPQTKDDMLAFWQGAQLHEFYGSTEGGFVTHLKPADQLRKIGCVGNTFAGTEVALRRADGSPCAPGEVGEIYSRGVFVGYEGYFRPEGGAGSGFTEDGWFSAGDMARQDEEGFVYLVDRKKDLIISGGENIYPTEVETVLLAHPEVTEVAVVGVPDPIWGDKVCAVVRRAAGSDLSDAALMDWSKGRLAGYKRPRRVEFWDQIPRNPTGKILRRIIRERLSLGQ